MRPSPTDADVPTPTIRLRSPGEIVSAVPYLVGFSPESSLVVLGLRGKGLVLTARTDLGDVSDERCLDGVVEALLNAGADRALLVALGDDRRMTCAALEETAARLGRARIAPLERISVIGGRWFDEGCTDDRCCPTDGVPVTDHDDAPSTMSMHALAGGYHRNRAAVVAECHPDRPVLCAAIRSELHLLLAEDRELDDDEAVAALAAVLGWSSEPPTPAQLALATLAMADPFLRDVCYAVVAPGMMGDHRPDLRGIHRALCRAGATAGDLDRHGILLDADAGDRVLARLLGWVRNLPEDAPGPVMAALVVVAVAHWCAGDGARSRVLTERARALDGPRLPMLETLTAALAHGVRPPGLVRLPGERPGDGRRRRAIA